MIKNDKYSIKGLFNHRHVLRFIIPEMQRDYVWREKNIKLLLDSIYEGYISYTKYDTNKDILPERAFNEIRKDECSTSIGFIYAYSSEEYPENYFLIDGQQRLTSIYLILLLLASSAEDKIKRKFRNIFFRNDAPILNYRVRLTAEDFFKKAVPEILKDPENIKELENKQWYTKEYDNDTTIKNCINNLNAIDSFFKAKNFTPEDYSNFYDYVLENTEVWYFDTNKSTQGENLYLSLNSRGISTEPHENTKPLLLGALKEEEREDWGEKWEEWQDYFWKERGDNPDADIGFNNFLRCIEGLYFYLDHEKRSKENPSEVSERSFPSPEEISYESIDLKTIESYINCLNLIDTHSRIFCDQYKDYYHDWVDEFVREFKKLIHEPRGRDYFTAWSVDYTDDTNTTIQANMLFVWGVMHLVTELNKQFESQKDKTDGEKEVEFALKMFRGIRQFYTKYNNRIRSVTKIKEYVARILDSDIRTADRESDSEKQEYAMLKWLDDRPQEQRKEYESLIWEIEDILFGLEGQDNMHVSLIEDLDENLSLKRLREIKDVILECFPREEKLHESDRFKNLISLLLYYGNFSERANPLYYFNHKFHTDRKIVTKREGEKYIFRNLLNDLIDKDIDELLKDKRDNFSLNYGREDPSIPLIERLRWYDVQVAKTAQNDNSIWKSGYHVAEADYKGLDSHFKNCSCLINTNGILGKKYPRLSDLIP